MKKILIILLLPALLFSCKKNNIGDFEVFITPDRFEFEPMPGGAVMKFTLTEEHSEVYQVEAVYKDDWNNNAYVLSGELVLDGLVKAGTIPVTIYLKNNKNERSDAINLSFEAEESYVSSILNDENISVEPYWNGFRILISDMPEKSVGRMHVFYRGIDKFTGKEADIMLNSFNINDNNSICRLTLNDDVWDDNGNAKIVITTEDLKNNIVSRKEFTTTYLEAELLTGISMHASSVVNSIEDENYSWRALFDGVKKTQGEDYLAFLSVNDMDQSEWIFDLGSNGSEVAYMRLHTQYWVSNVQFAAPYQLPQFASLNPGSVPAFYTTGLSIREKLPSDVEVYATNDLDGTWTKIGEYRSAQGSATFDTAWSRDCSMAAHTYIGIEQRLAYDSVEDFPELSMEVDLTGAGNTVYRYIKVKVLDNFDTFGDVAGTSGNVNDANTSEQISFSELEFFVKK